MPPLTLGRASKACVLCRRLKTRCYAKDGIRNACLRCHTLSLSCSLEDVSDSDSCQSPSAGRRRGHRDRQHGIRRPSTDSRLERLEQTVSALVDRLDSQAQNRGTLTRAVQARTEERAPAEANPAPVLLIRDAATDAGVSPPGQFDSLPSSTSDVISSGLVTLATAHSLLQLFRVHYGRWVRFSEHTPTETLLEQVRQSPLLLCSVLLIAVRHTTQALADELAPRLFRDAQRLVSRALLVAAQPAAHFQAVLILSLWSTTVGQQPLSIDGWLLTGYALQQGFACFPGRGGPRQDAEQQQDVDAACLWNHLCVAHLQYCVGTRRQALLRQEHVDRCAHPAGTGSLGNYEARMVAEVKLYWVMYTECCPQTGPVDVQAAKAALQEWKREWASLFDEPRSQFLQMGFHFAHLVAYYQSARSPQSSMDTSVMREMVDLSSTIINLAMDTADDRTRHLTDHIYHIITFSALTLCRLVHTYEEQLRMDSVNVDGLDGLVARLVRWLRCIGLPCHAAHLLSDVVASQFQKLRPDYQASDTAASVTTQYSLSALDAALLSSNMGFYPDLIGSELFGMDDGVASWPQWN